MKILVATHKPYWIPNDDIYLPIQVGSAGKSTIKNFQRDDDGDNISERNSDFAELTALYWAWKNLSCEYIGLCHYRRYFGNRIFSRDPQKLQNAIFHRDDFEQILSTNDLMLPRQRNYFIETVRSQYSHAHPERDLIDVENILREKFPEYLSAFENVMNRRRVHLFNMFVMPKRLADEYCSWLFEILFTHEQNYSTHENRRIYGCLAERLLDVWLYFRDLKIAENNVVMLENVNWTRKIFSFIGRKFKSRR